MSSFPKSVHILGATGSVGQSAAEVILANPARFNVALVTAQSNAALLASTAVRLGAKKAVIADEAAGDALLKALSGTGIVAEAGQAALLAASGAPCDITLAAIAGFAGLEPLLAALGGSRAVAIANKEPLVAAGPLVIARAKEAGVTILPLDSEHNAIFQVFDFKRPGGVEKIILTASGGPFRTWSAAEIENAPLEKALAHPNWNMGPKITIDSASMMNKALEMIEAHYLFDMEPERIEVLVHPQSIVHSLVAYRDGSFLAQLGAPDMRTPIAYALGWPGRIPSGAAMLDLATAGGLTFESPDTARFPALSLARRAMALGPAACLTLNAANEAAVSAYLDGAISFGGISACVARMLDELEKGLLGAEFATIDISGPEHIITLDHLVRARASAYICV